ncbi:MAG: glycoside hydrolase family 11 protein [Ruminococcus sp.]|nr:glycoside hydrolase family 11 protein [Ruminococcus sp.]
MKHFFKQAAAMTAASALIASAVPFSASAAGESYTKSKTGQTSDGYDFELWNENEAGNVKMELGENGGFSCSWNGIQNCLFRTGKRLGSTKNWDEYEGINISYDVDYTPKGNSYMCVYGWTEDPLVEYYIVDAWGDWRPPGMSNDQAVAQVTVNGNSYHIFKSQRVDKPSIHGNTTFWQYWSVRDENPARVNAKTHLTGDIDVAAHFAAWEKAGLKMGKMYEVALNIEGYMSNGEAVVNKNTLSFTKGTTPDPDRTTVTTTTTMAEPDKDGYFFRSSFESGEDDWFGRGSAKVSTSDAAKSNGSKSLAVTGRTDNWNGTAYNLDPTQFAAGGTYSFGVMAMQDSGEATDLKLTMQYTLNGDENYDEIATVKANSGEWVQLANPSYTIPAGAKNALIYVEAPSSLTDFYIDDAFGAAKGTVVTPDQPSDPSSALRLGDVNDDGNIDVYDLIAMRKSVVKMMAGVKFPKQADVNQDGELSVADLVWLSGYLHGTEKKLPDPPKTTTTTTTTTTTKKQEVTTTTTSSQTTGGNLNKKVSGDMPVSVPGGVEKTSGCKVEHVSYDCKFTGGQKSCNVILPPNYSASKKYPVMYVLHGIGGDENSMINGMGVQELLTGLISGGQAEEMIIVCPAQYTSKKPASGFGINQEVCEAYDNFLYDISDSLIDFIESKYSVKTGRENRAITGFSMGGREAIYCGLMRPDLFGYVGGACPAPGIVAAQDMFMTHPGCMTESEMKFRDVGPEPSLFMITGGTNDSVVGTFPKQYSDILTRNGVDHVYQSIPGGGHGADSVKPHLYTFMRYAFK